MKKRVPRILTNNLLRIDGLSSLILKLYSNNTCHNNPKGTTNIQEKKLIDSN